MPEAGGSAGRIAGLTFRHWALALAGFHLAAGLLLFEPALFPGGDNADYMILGEALRTGEGYRSLHLPGSPLHTTYPPGYPALLAVLGVLGSVQLFKLASLALTAGTVWVTAQLGRRMAGEGTGLLAAGLLAVNPVLLDYSHYVLSEAPFTFLLVFALFALGRGGWSESREPIQTRGQAGRILAVGLAAAVVAFLTRTAGLTILLAIPVAALLAGRRRRAGLAALAGVAAMAAWAIYQRVAAPGETGYLGQLVLSNPYDPEAGSVGLAGLVARAAGNLWTYVSSVVPVTVTGIGGGPDGSALLTVTGIILCALALAGWGGRAMERIRTPEVFALLYAGLIVLWPEVWTDRRFLLPALPLLLVYTVAGSRRLADRYGAAPWLAPALVALLALPALGSIGRLVPGRVDCVAGYRAGTPCDAPAMASFYEAARWARDNTEPDAIIANRKPSLFFWFSRRQGGLYRYSAETELVLRGLEQMRARYVVVDQISGTTVRYLVPTIQEHRTRFRLLYEGGEPPTLVLEFRERPTTALATPPDPP